MELTIKFSFRHKVYDCTILIDSSAYPCYVFVIFADRELTSEFGEEITIKTDCEKLLAKKDDYPQLVKLRQAIFDVVKSLPAFTSAKKDLKQFSLSLKEYGKDYRNEGVSGCILRS